MKPNYNTLSLNSDGSITIKDFEFTLQREDFQIVANTIMPRLEASTGKQNTLAEVLFTCLTYGIHKAYEDATGEKFILRMDREKPKA